jgi:hypothetical protein
MTHTQRHKHITSAAIRVLITAAVVTSAGGALAAVPHTHAQHGATHFTIATRSGVDAPYGLVYDASNAPRDSFQAEAVNRFAHVGQSKSPDWSGYGSDRGDVGSSFDGHHVRHGLDSWDKHVGHHVGDEGGHTPAVPEPHTYLLMLGGLGLIGYAVRRQRSIR